MSSSNKRVEEDHNEDLITGEHGSHPVGTGLGAAAAGAAAGAAGGAVAGPVGAVAGAVIGGVAGGLGGKAIAEEIDPTVENAYWEKNYAQREYTDADESYSTYKPAYQYGWESRGEHKDADFATAEPALQREWTSRRGNSKMDWASARPATKDAWDRATEHHN